MGVGPTATVALYERLSREVVAALDCASASAHAGLPGEYATCY